MGVGVSFVTGFERGLRLGGVLPKLLVINSLSHFTFHRASFHLVYVVDTAVTVVLVRSITWVSSRVVCC